MALVSEKYLTESAEDSIYSILNGNSLVSILNYADDIKSDKRFDKYKSWHYLNINLDDDY